MSGPFEHQQAEEFLRLVHQGLDGLVAFQFKKGDRHTQEFTSPMTIPKRTLASVHGGWHVYVSLCTFQSKSRKEANALMAPGCWLDIDPPAGGPVEGWGLGAMDRILKFEVHPSIVVHSGRGFHAHWLFDEPLQLQGDDSEGNLALLRGCNRALIKALDGDPSLKPASSYLRLPGTPNPKEGAGACEVLLSSRQRYTFSELVESLGASADEPTVASTSRSSTSAKPTATGSGGGSSSTESSTSGIKVRVSDLKTLSPRHRKLVKEGVAAWQAYGSGRGRGDASRSAVEMSVVAEMVRVGWKDELIRAAFEREDWAVGGRYRELVEKQGTKRAKSNLSRTIRKARKSN